MIASCRPLPFDKGRSPPQLILLVFDRSLPSQVRLAASFGDPAMGCFVRSANVSGLQLVFRSGGFQLRRYDHHLGDPGKQKATSQCIMPQTNALLWYVLLSPFFFLTLVALVDLTATTRTPFVDSVALNATVYLVHKSGWWHRACRRVVHMAFP